MQKITAAIELMRIDKPIGIYLLLWPALLTLIISTQGNFTMLHLGIVIVGSILVRSAGCVINDIWDKDIDQNVERTKFRAIPSKRISVTEAWLLFMILGALSIYLLTMTNINTVLVSILFIILIVIYPLTKRFFIGPQLFLGITFNPTIIVYAMTEELNNPSMGYLFFAIAFQTIAFDSFYGLCDEKDDRNLKIKSTPIWWGKKTLKIIACFQVLSILLLAKIGLMDELKLIWFAGLILLGGFFVYQQKLANKKKYFEAFKNNHWANLLLLVTAVICYVI
ncbi:4-hydroxybenzoate octaprenyltransferase [Gammaproteobacteria bacterium]|nr:4-hydroxybenzoate octaprenyltransferase [Gammaproteobacteria bacterium]|tara:strand:+ start:892 stop:1731 length:840 start_codon:yes stop_codon:yes gene_type:complete